MDSQIIFKIEPIELYTYSVRIISIIVIALCIYNFEINPLAFTIFSLVALCVILLSRTSRIVLTNDYLLIEHKNIISFMSNIKKVSIADIDQIGFNKEFKPIARYLLPEFYLFPTQNNEILLRLKDNSEISQTQIGTKKQFLGLLAKVAELVSKQPGANKS